MRRLRDGEWLAGAGGAALLASLFLDWYGHRTAWQALAVVDVLLALLALVPLALVVAQATRRSPAVPVALSVLTALAGALAVVLIAFRLIDLPGAAVQVHGGAWFALGAALLVAVGGWRSLRAERIPGVPVPVVEALPAPPP
jgi:hypothetical protein